MAAINKVILIGNLGKDPEAFTFENGNKKVSFSLATTESWKDKNGARQEHTEWHNIVAYGNVAEIALNFLKKGSQIYLEGRIRTRSWEDNGQKRYMTEIEMQQLTMLGKPEGANQSTQSQQPQSIQPLQEILPEGGDDDLPF